MCAREGPALAPALDLRLGLRAPRQRSRAARTRGRAEIAEALSVLVPPAWQNDPRLDDEVRDFHRYGAMLSEPWDGPAALCFTDGRTCGAALDRNGLRPLRVAIAGDELLAVSSEAGAVPLPDGVPLRRSRLGPGGVMTLDPDRGLLVDAELRRDLATRRPYGGWVESSIVRVGIGEPVEPPDASLDARHVLHGYTREELNGSDRSPRPATTRCRRWATTRRSPARRPRPAVVDLPAPALRAGDESRDRPSSRAPRHVGLDPARRPFAVARSNRAAADPDGSPGFLLYPDRIDALEPRVLDATFTEEEGLRRSLDRIVVLAVAAVAAGDTLLCLSDAEAGTDRAPVPALLAVSAVHTRLVEMGLRMRCSLLVSSDEPRDTHGIACLLGYGADAICPRLALETVAHLAADDKVGGDRPSPEEAQRRLLAGLEEGVLKVMSKMGISDVASYRGARLFEAIGLDRTLCAELLAGTPSAIGGARLERFEREALDRLEAARAARPRLDNPGT